MIVAKLHARFYTYQMPDALAFFGGARFVPIITAIVLGVVGLVVPLVWPWFAAGINGIGALISHAGPFGPFLFGTGERLLLPLGLHHSGGAHPLYRGGRHVAGVRQRGERRAQYLLRRALLRRHHPVFGVGHLFLSGQDAGLPRRSAGAALAMYHCARPENRGKIKALLVSGVVACVIGGITEPLEFLFLFVAPVLYVIHAILTGLGFMTMGLLGVTIGNTDGNLIDFLVFGVLQGTATKWYLVPVAAAIWFAIYYGCFALPSCASTSKPLVVKKRAARLKPARLPSPRARRQATAAITAR